MHFEVLVEDPSGKRALDIFMPRIIGEHETFRVIASDPGSRPPVGPYDVPFRRKK